MAGKIR